MTYIKWPRIAVCSSKRRGGKRGVSDPATASTTPPASSARGHLPRIAQCAEPHHSTHLTSAPNPARLFHPTQCHGSHRRRKNDNDALQPECIHWAVGPQASVGWEQARDHRHGDQKQARAEHKRQPEALLAIGVEELRHRRSVRGAVRPESVARRAGVPGLVLTHASFTQPVRHHSTPGRARHLQLGRAAGPAHALPRASRLRARYGEWGPHGSPIPSPRPRRSSKTHPASRAAADTSR
jgi:hypothetical protein